MSNGDKICTCDDVCDGACEGAYDESSYLEETEYPEDEVTAADQRAVPLIDEEGVL